MNTTITAIATPDADDLVETAADLTECGGSIAKIVEGLTEIAHAEHTPDSTSLMFTVLGGGGDTVTDEGGIPDVLQLLALVVQRLGNPDTNPALRELSTARQAEICRLTSEYAAFDREFAPKELLNEAAGYADPYCEGEPPERTS